MQLRGAGWQLRAALVEHHRPVRQDCRADERHGGGVGVEVRCEAWWGGVGPSVKIVEMISLKRVFRFKKKLNLV